MASLNQCNFIGRVGKDPDTKYLSCGDAVTNITLAVDESYKNKSGEKVDKVEWINVTFYRKLAEIAGEYLKKGGLIFISGKMETRKYTAKNGVERYATGIVAHEMKMLVSKQGNQERSSPAQNSSGPDDMDSDVPF